LKIKEGEYERKERCEMVKSAKNQRRNKKMASGLSPPSVPKKKGRFDR